MKFSTGLKKKTGEMLRRLIIICFIALSACTDDTGAENELSGTALSIKKRALTYADSVDRQMTVLNRKSSMVYTRGDYTFYAVQYGQSASPVLLVENGSSTNDGRVENRYYLSDGKVVLHKRHSHSARSESAHDFRTFFENGTALFSDSKSSVADSTLELMPYRVSDRPYRGINTDLDKLRDAIDQRGDFDLRIEGITQYPKARYLVLSRNSFNAYRAALLVEKDDPLIRAISADTEKYKGRKVSLTWSVREPGQAIYISGKLAD